MIPWQRVHMLRMSDAFRLIAAEGPRSTDICDPQRRKYSHLTGYLPPAAQQHDVFIEQGYIMRITSPVLLLVAWIGLLRLCAMTAKGVALGRYGGRKIGADPTFCRKQ